MAFSYFRFRQGRAKQAWAAIAGVAVLTIVFEVIKALPLSFARYPVTSYVLQSPLQGLLKRILQDESINANRLFESLSPVVWLFVLRPFILRKALSWEVIGALLLMLLQADTLFYFGGAYLEPWSIVFSLVAIEALCSCKDYRLAFASLGTAALIKEQAMVLFPMIGLGAWAIERFQWRKLLNLGIWFTVSLIPFLSYFLYRRDAHISRKVDPVGLAELVNPTRLEEWLFRVTSQFSTLGAWLLLALIPLVIFYSWRSRKRFFNEEFFVLGAALMLALFFYCDKVSIPWSGYPRFHLYSFALLIFIATGLAFRQRSRLLYLYLGTFGLTQLPGFFKLWTFHDELNVNFFEHYEAPIFLPIHPVFKYAEAAHGLSPGADVQIIEMTGLGMLKQFEMGYSHYANRYRVQISNTTIEKTDFVDPGLRPLSVLIPLVRTANLNLNKKHGLYFRNPKLQDAAILRIEQSIRGVGGSWEEVIDSNGQRLGFISLIR